jgi:hypothetical protein
LNPETDAISPIRGNHAIKITRVEPAHLAFRIRRDVGLAVCARRHWRIENKSHYARDVTFRRTGASCGIQKLRR